MSSHRTCSPTCKAAQRQLRQLAQPLQRHCAVKHGRGFWHADGGLQVQALHGTGQESRSACLAARAII